MNATVIWAGPLPSSAGVNLVDRTGRKAQGEVGAEAHHLLGRVRVAADRLAVWVEALEHAHGLKEVKPIPFLEEDTL